MDLNCAKRQRRGILRRRLNLSQILVLHIGKEHAVMLFYKVLLRLLQCLSSRLLAPASLAHSRN